MGYSGRNPAAYRTYLERWSILERELVQDYLIKSGMKDAQAETLSLILAEMATKRDLDQLKSDLTWRFVVAVSFLATLVTFLDLFID